MMLAADRIAANVLTASPELRDALSKILEDFARVAPVTWRIGSGESARYARFGDQMARRLVAMRLTNLHETTAHEEQACGDLYGGDR